MTNDNKQNNYGCTVKKKLFHNIKYLRIQIRFLNNGEHSILYRHLQFKNGVSLTNSLYVITRDSKRNIFIGSVRKF